MSPLILIGQGRVVMHKFLTGTLRFDPNSLFVTLPYFTNMLHGTRYSRKPTNARYSFFVRQAFSMKQTSHVKKTVTNMGSIRTLKWSQLNHGMKVNHITIWLPLFLLPS